MIQLESWQKILLAILLAFGVGYGSGRYVQPAKVEIKTQEVIKEVEVVKHDTITVTKEIKKPDGTTEIDTTITDKDVETTTIADVKKTEETITNLKPQWNVRGLVGVSSFNFANPMVYGLNIERRIIGPIFVGAWGTTDKSAGLSIGLEF
jgi:hypothetical protein